MVVAGLGPAGPELMTAAVMAAVERIPHRFLRTSRHPAAAAVPDGASFDHIYEQATSFEEVYENIVAELVSAASELGEVLYLVPGSPGVAEHTVELLGDQPGIELEVLPAPSFLDLAWARVGDPVATGPRIIDGHRFPAEAAGERGPLLVMQCDSRLVLSNVKLAVDSGFEHHAPRVTVLQRLGLPDESVFEVEWQDLDRAVDPDDLTSLWIPRMAAPVAGEVARLAELVRTLRARCPWDREQTHKSLSRHLLEETYEILEAIDDLEAPESAGYIHLEEELGDLLVQVCFHATLAAEQGQFTLADVAQGVHDKLVSRHPHVFGEVQADTPAQVAANWEQIKKTEKGRQSIMDGVPASLPSLLYAQKIQAKAASAGYPLESVQAQEQQLSEEELGQLLFSMVGAARSLGLDAEAALRRTTAHFRDQFMTEEGSFWST